VLVATPESSLTSREEMAEQLQMEDRWLSVEEIAAYLGIVRESVYRWVVRRGMPGHKVGRHWKFRREEVDEWVRSGGARDKSGDNPEQITPMTNEDADT